MNILLKDFIKHEKIIHLPFEYANTNGYADVIGWNIMFFFKKESNHVSAISFDEIMETSELSIICNEILKKMQIQLNIGDGYDKIKRMYGKENYKDYIIENMIRYYYLVDNTMLCFGIDKQCGLSNFEIIDDEEIIKNRLDTLIR